MMMYVFKESIQWYSDLLFFEIDPTLWISTRTRCAFCLRGTHFKNIVMQPDVYVVASFLMCLCFPFSEGK